MGFAVVVGAQAARQLGPATEIGAGPTTTRSDLSKIEAGKLELNPHTVAPLIDEVVGTALAACRAESEPARRRGGSESRRPERGCDAVAADPAQSPEQRVHVHRSGRGRAARAQGRGWTTLDRAGGRRTPNPSLP